MRQESIAARTRSGYTLRVTSKKGVIGIGLPDYVRRKPHCPADLVASSFLTSSLAVRMWGRKPAGFPYVTGSPTLPDCRPDWTLDGRLTTSRTDPLMAPLPLRTSAQIVYDHSLNLTHSLYCCVAFTEAGLAQIDCALDSVALAQQTSLINAFYLFSAIKDKINLVIEELDHFPRRLRGGER